MYIIYIKKKFCKFTQNVTNPSTNNHCHQHQQFFSVIQKKNYVCGETYKLQSGCTDASTVTCRFIMFVFVSPVHNSKSDLLFLYLTCDSPSTLHWLLEKFNQIRRLGRKSEFNLELLNLRVQEGQQDSGLSFNHGWLADLLTLGWN